MYEDLPGELPKDEEGYVVSFAAEEKQALREFFDKYGLVVIRDVLPDEQIEETLSEFWNGVGEGARDDPMQWGDYFDNQYFGRMGIIGMGPNLRSVAQLKNRQAEGVYQAYCSLFGTEKLWVDHDRLGVMRPTRNIRFPDGTVQDRPKWKTISNWLHTDCNPNTGKAAIAGFDDDGSYIDFRETLIIQSLISLSDAREEDGGFHCVPGSHKHCIAWARERGSVNSNLQVPEDDPIRKHIQNVPIRRGCLLLWTSLLFHGNHPNDSDRFRYVQYIRAMPTTGTPYSPLCPDPSMYPKGFSPSPLGRKLFGWEPW
eukprot:Sspe_Gene.21434::Locus_8035_Transcript_1_1_Confidence_1.000_Length_1101::g.21434::m.21434